MTKIIFKMVPSGDITHMSPASPTCHRLFPGVGPPANQGDMGLDWKEGVNGVNRLATKGVKYYRLPTKREKNYWLPTEKKLTDYRHGPPLSIFVFRKKRSEEHFAFFLAYEVTTLKVIIEFPVIFLLFGRKSAGSFCRTISGTQAHDTSRCNISTTFHRTPP